MFKILKLFRVRKVVKFIMIVTLTYPNFEVFLSYSNEEQFEITPIFEGSMITVVAFFASIWLILYNSTFASLRTRHFTFAAIMMRYAGSILLAKQMSVEISAEKSKSLFLVNSFVFQPVVQAYLITPAAIIFAKCVPHSIEGLMMGFITSIVKTN